MLLVGAVLLDTYCRLMLKTNIDLNHVQITSNGTIDDCFVHKCFSLGLSWLWMSTYLGYFGSKSLPLAFWYSSARKPTPTWLPLILMECMNLGRRSWSTTTRVYCLLTNFKAIETLRKKGGVRWKWFHSVHKMAKCAQHSTSPATRNNTEDCGRKHLSNGEIL